MLKRWISAYRLCGENGRNLPDVRKAAADFGLLALLCVYPVLLLDAYFNLMQIRITFFAVVSVVVFFVCLFADLAQRRLGFPAPQRRSEAPTRTWIFLCAFTILIFFSLLFSENPISALTGEQGRYMGALSYACICLAFLFILRFSRVRPWMLYPFGAVVIFVVIVGYLQFIGLDLLHLLQGMTASARKNFISTLGNINVFSSFMCICAPVFMHMYCCAEQENRFFFLLLSGFCNLGLFIANSDSGYIGFFAAFCVTAYSACGHSDAAARRFLHLAAVFFASGILFSVFCRAGANAVRTVSRITHTVTNGALPFVLLAVFVSAAILLRGKTISSKTLRRMRVGVLIFSAAAVLAVLGGVIVCTFLIPQKDLGYAARYLRFDDEWGTGRGGIWRLTMQIFRNLTPDQKLFGIGPDTLGVLMWDKYRLEMFRITHSYIDNAHNELLQYLVTHGILGLACYLGFLVIGIGSALRAKELPACSRGFAAAALCYAMQSVVNILQPITTPLLFVCIAAAQSGFYADPSRACVTTEGVDEIENAQTEGNTA